MKFPIASRIRTGVNHLSVLLDESLRYREYRVSDLNHRPLEFFCVLLITQPSFRFSTSSRVELERYPQRGAHNRGSTSPRRVHHMPGTGEAYEHVQRWKISDPSCRPARRSNWFECSDPRNVPIQTAKQPYPRFLATLNRDACGA